MSSLTREARHVNAGQLFADVLQDANQRLSQDAVAALMAEGRKVDLDCLADHH